MAIFYNGILMIKGKKHFDTMQILIRDGLLAYDGTTIKVSYDEIEVKYESADLYIDKLESAMYDLAKEDVHVNGRLDYHGDLDGAYIITENVGEDYDKYDLAILEMSDRQLEDEAKRRGYRLVKESDYKPPAEFEPIKKTEYFEAV